MEIIRKVATGKACCAKCHQVIKAGDMDGQVVITTGGGYHTVRKSFHVGCVIPKEFTKVVPTPRSTGI